MIDITLSILALVAGGVSLELFASTNSASAQTDATALPRALDESLAGNPS